ncbi:MAG: hypothetical protein WDZ59_17585 [Pirellulales bacterium]
MDVRVAGKWDGILVVDTAGMCVGVYFCRRVGECFLGFSADQIEDIRRASLLNRFLAGLPFDLYRAGVFTILVISPIALLLGVFFSPFFATFSMVACAAAIYLMSVVGGFILMRLPVVLFGLGQIVSAGILLLRLLL